MWGRATYDNLAGFTNFELPELDEVHSTTSM
jgi:hypothetical protein